MTLADRIVDLCHQHGSLRAAARVLKMDHAYLSRLLSGEKSNPSAPTLRKLGLVAITSYKLKGVKK